LRTREVDVAESRYRYPKNERIGGYYVQLRPRLEELGRIRKHERSYNLRRLIIIRGWIATTPDGETLGREQRHGEPTIYRTREEAAEALEEAYKNGRA
jgi:hypothetical protein